MSRATFAPMGLECPEPGVYYGVPNATYHQWRWYLSPRLEGKERVVEECLSNSSLAPMAQTEWHFRWAMDSPESRDEQRWDHFDVGSAFHTLCLEPSRWAQDVVIEKRPDRRGAKGKAAYSAIVEDAGDRALINPEQEEQVRAMAAAAQADPDLGPLLRAEGDTEVSIVSTIGGQRMRGRIDKQIPALKAILDLKTAVTADPGRFNRKTMYDLGYHRQAGLYSWLNELEAGWVPEKVLYAVIEKDSGHPITVIEMDPEDVALGRAEILSFILSYSRCVETDTWPAWADHIVQGRLPDWAKEKLRKILIELQDALGIETEETEEDEYDYPD